MTISKHDILDTALTIAQEYRRDQMVLTVRQMYYQFVRRFPGLYPSSQDTYNRIKTVLGEARYRNEFPMDMIEDRGREVRPGKFTDFNGDLNIALDDAANEVRNLPNWLNMHKWYGQDTHVSVWVEKDALSGVFEKPCDDLGVSWFACKGYPSISALWAYLEGLNEASRVHPDGGFEQAVILYFGDHDPDGLEIPDSSLRGINRLRESYGILGDVDIKVDRIALTLDQIRQYGAPPFPAKETSSRFRKYQDKTGLDDAWELDALEPKALRKLITESVEPLFDHRVYRSYADDILRARAEMIRQIKAPGWLDSVFEGGISGDDGEE